MKKKVTILLPLSKDDSYPITVRLSSYEIDKLSEVGYPILTERVLRYHIPVKRLNPFILKAWLVLQDLVRFAIFNRGRHPAFLHILRDVYKNKLSEKQEIEYQKLKSKDDN